MTQTEETRPPWGYEQPEIRDGCWKLHISTVTPSGTPVRVLNDDGQIWETRTRSEPWQLGHGQWVVLLAGRTGGYMLERLAALEVRPRPAGDEAP